MIDDDFKSYVQNGFTLIELLIVLAFISILGAIAFGAIF